MALFESDSWVAANGQAPDGPVLVRIRKHDPDPQEKARFSNLVIVKWEFDPAANGGLPTLAEVDLMGQLEERLFSVFSETSDVGCGVAVFTIPGFRDWRFYTPDTQRFIEVFNQVMQGEQVYPIALEAFADPEWAAFDEIRPRMED